VFHRGFLPLQAVTFLVIGNKPKKSLDDITRDLCPVLSIDQLYRLSTMFWDDKYNKETVSSEVRRHHCIGVYLVKSPWPPRMASSAWYQRKCVLHMPQQVGLVLFCSQRSSV
jgi:hypothetical protein